MENKGYVHVYTGNGKGKTTSAIGMAVRAVGASKRVYFGQFMKYGDYSEIKILKERFPDITVEQYGGDIIISKASSSDIKHAYEGFEKAKETVYSGKYDLIILDEINVAVFMELVPLSDVLELIKNKPEEVELVLTGRYADKKILEAADLVSDIVQVKHYFTKGVPARLGIEM